MPTVEVLVDQAVEGATSPDLLKQRPEGQAYAQFAHDLLAAVSEAAELRKDEAEFGLLSDAVPPEHRRLIAWALMRYLAAWGVFPSKPYELRPRAIKFIKDVIEHDLTGHHVEFQSQSHEVERALSGVVSSIEHGISEAVAFRSFAALQDFEQGLLETVNSRRNAGLLYIFAKRSLVQEAIKKSCGAVREFLDADGPMVHEMYEYARDACTDMHADLQEDGTRYAAQLIASVPKALQEALDLEITKRPEAQPATLSLTPVAKKYPLHDSGKDLDIRLMLGNSGNGAAFDIQVRLESTNELDLASGELHVGTLSPGESRPLHLAACVVESEEIALLRATVEWRNFDQRIGRQESNLELDAQDPMINWAVLETERPYRLDAALGERFIGRKSLLSKLIGHVSSTNPGSLYLWGQKRVGKTSLVRALADSVKHRTGDFAVAYLETIRELTPEQTTNGICRRLITQLKAEDQRFAGVMEPDYTGTLSPLSDFLDQLQLIAPEKRFLIIIDEFDELPVELYKARGVADTFFQTLGKGIAGKSHVGVVIVGGERMPAIIRAQAMRLNMYRAEEIDHFERSDEFSNLVRQPGSPLEFSDDAIDRLWDYSAGNPYFLNEICSRLAETMIERRDAYVTADEVDEAILHTLNAIDTNSFAHYWDDGIVEVEPNESSGQVTDRVRFLVAAAEALQDGNDLMSKQDLTELAGKHGCKPTSVDRLLRDFQQRGVLDGDEHGYRLRVRLFQEWIRGRGFVQLNAKLWDDLGNSDRIEDELAAPITETELEELVTTWGPYQGGVISPFQVHEWLAQFGDAGDQRLMFQMLRNVKFYRQSLIHNYFGQAQQLVARGLVRQINTPRQHRRDILVSYLGPVGRSGPQMARWYRQVNEIWAENNVGPGEMVTKLRSDPDIRAVVFVDDFVGTGRTAERHFREFFANEPEAVELMRSRQTAVSYVVVAGIDVGLRHLEHTLLEAPIRVSVIAKDELGAESRAFDPQSAIWADTQERDLAKEIATSFGKRLESKAPLGFGDSQGLVVFEGNCPNTSLPILYKRRKVHGDAFRPLFPRSS